MPEREGIATTSHEFYSTAEWQRAYNRTRSEARRVALIAGHRAWTLDGCPSLPPEDRLVLTPAKRLSVTERKAKREEAQKLMVKMAADDKERAEQVRLALPRLWARYFDKIGVELEGGWTRRQWQDVERHELLRAGEPVTHPATGVVTRWTRDQQRQAPQLRRVSDGSVNISVPPPVSVDERMTHIGEMAVGPVADLELMATTLQQHWPKVVNATCGFHIHVSVKRDLYYLRLMDPEVTTLVCNALGEWGRAAGLAAGHPLWQRLSGENRFCSPVYRGDAQIVLRSKDSDRYTALNYCKQLHGTIEARILPMFATADQGIAAMHQVITTLGMWLHSKRGTERQTATREEIEILDEENMLATMDTSQAGFRAYTLA